MSYLYVCNNGKADFQDRYDGVDYVFPKGQTVQIPPDAARHIFGYGEGDKSRAMRRQGVMLHSTDGPKAQEWLNQFSWEEVEPPPPPNLAAKQRAPRGAQGVDSSDAVPTRRGRLEPMPPNNAA